jgi:hypothetical protein
MDLLEARNCVALDGALDCWSWGKRLEQSSALPFHIKDGPTDDVLRVVRDESVNQLV